MWKGYLAENHKNERLICLLDGIEYKYLHTSGHADPTTIETLIATVQPNAILPIHTENASWFIKRYPHITVTENTLDLN
jgi:ribonuclease J